MSHLPASIPADSSRLSLLGDDLNDAGRRLRAVEGRGGRALDPLDGLDVVGIDCIERRRRLAEHVVVTLTTAVDAYAIHVDRWIVARVERARAAQTIVGRRAGLARAGQERQSGHL